MTAARVPSIERATPQDSTAASDPAVRSSSTMSEATPYAVNYHAWVFDSFAPYLKRGVALEIGSGHGIYARKLADVVDTVIVSDIDPAAVDAIRAELATVLNVDYVVMDGVDRGVLGRRVDDVVLVNVLEHIRDDRALLRSAYDALETDGRIVVFTPAFPQLYSRMDRDAGHHRRYTRGGLVDLMRSVGFDVVEARLFNAVGFFGWYANKLAGSGLHAKHTSAQVMLYDRLVPIFRRIDRFVPFLGQSVLAVGRKQ